MKNTETLTELTLTEIEMVSGGSDTVNGKVKFGINIDLEIAPTGTPVLYSETTTGTVK
ncbi:MAG: hypothetical protein MJK04_22995 [Psychrosphaera sp.]|nr:hypothetical protein [Psychrosphaera sp.]